jgi:hypothetical protein
MEILSSASDLWFQRLMAIYYKTSLPAKSTGLVTRGGKKPPTSAFSQEDQSDLKGSQRNSADTQRVLGQPICTCPPGYGSIGPLIPRTGTPNALMSCGRRSTKFFPTASRNLNRKNGACRITVTRCGTAACSRLNKSFLLNEQRRLDSWD